MSTCDSEDWNHQVEKAFLTILPPIAILILALLAFTHHEQAIRTIIRLANVGIRATNAAGRLAIDFGAWLGGGVDGVNRILRNFTIAAVLLLTVWICLFGYFLGAGLSSGFCIANTFAYYLAALIVSSFSLVFISVRYQIRMNPANINRVIRDEIQTPRLEGP